jgi:hypothetical protein
MQDPAKGAFNTASISVLSWAYRRSSFNRDVLLFDAKSLFVQSKRVQIGRRLRLTKRGKAMKGIGSSFRRWQGCLRILFFAGSVLVFALMQINLAWGHRLVYPSQKLLAFGTESNRFGRSVSVSEDVALVGAFHEDDRGYQSGSAHILRWNGRTWVQEQKLLASDGAAGDWFGFSVSVSGDVALVGALYNDDQGASSGAAYIFRWNGRIWVQEQKLLASDGAAGDWFGSSVSVSGDVALVGADGDDDQDSSAGSAYIFRWNGRTWVEEQKLLASDGAQNAIFGWSVSVSGDVALVGAWGDDDQGYRSGSAYIFGWDGSAWVEEQKLLASDGAAGDYFGRSVSVRGEVALIGAFYDNDQGDSSGAAYIFRWNGSVWIEEQKLLASDGAADDEFGSSVSVSGNIALVGAYHENSQGYRSGSAYIFHWDGSAWVEEQKLLASDGASYDEFGASVSVSGDVALVGACGGDDQGYRSGSAYSFRSNGDLWVEEQKLLAPYISPNAYFGTSVSISEEVALVGAGKDNDQGYRSGSVYIFGWSGSAWVQQQKLLASDGASYDEFGASVSVSGDVALVGAPYDDEQGYNSGSVYIFGWDGSAWVQQQKLLASDGANYDEFGRSVSVSGDVALVSAPYDDDRGSNSGSAYIFRWNGSDWVQEQKLLVFDGANYDEFGSSVSVSGDVALVGAWGDDDRGSNSGSAYIFRWNGSDWVQEQKLLASDVGSHDEFGRSVSASGDVVLVSAHFDDDRGSNSGSVYSFRWNGNAWGQEQKLLASDGGSNDDFGRSLSVSGDVALVGAWGGDDQGSNSGSAYIFRWNGSAWVEEQKLLSSDGAEGEVFGTSVSVNEDIALVGAWGNNDQGFNAGSAYVFDKRIWGDLNGDGVVDRSDIDIIRSHINQPASVCPECDTNLNGTIDIADVRKLMTACNTPGCR